MIWNVYRENINTRRIEVFNIFNHSSFYKEVTEMKKMQKKNKITKEEFAEALRKELMYYFWCKCEYEVAISGLFDSDLSRASKIDIYSQVLLNWDVFVDYVWEAKI